MGRLRHASFSAYFAALLACGARTSLPGGNLRIEGGVEEAGVEAGVRDSRADAIGAADAADAADATDATCVLANGCADQTREGLTDEKKFPLIAACSGSCTGYIDGSSAASLCSACWHVCRGSDAAVRALSGADAGFAGCFAYDAAQDCNYCSATCRGIVTDPNRPCTVTDDTTDADMAGLGAGCIQEPPTMTSCLPDRRIDASQGKGNVRSFGCTCNAQLTGVVCCKD